MYQMTDSETIACIREQRVRPECLSVDCEWDECVYQLTREWDQSVYQLT